MLSWRVKYNNGQYQFMLSFLVILLPDFEDLVSDELARSEVTWGQAMQCFSFGYAGFGVAQALDIEVFEDISGKGSKEDVDEVNRALNATDPTEHFERLGSLERCARPGCLCISESCLAQCSK